MTSGATLDLRDRVRDVPDFPKPGIVFKDLMPLVADATYFRETIDRLEQLARPLEPDIILGAEARGFIFGGALADRLRCGFVPARKPGKLPWETVEATYELEYGTDSLQVHADALGEGLARDRARRRAGHRRHGEGEDGAGRAARRGGRRRALRGRARRS